MRSSNRCVVNVDNEEVKKRPVVACGRVSVQTVCVVTGDTGVSHHIESATRHDMPYGLKADGAMYKALCE